MTCSALEWAFFGATALAMAGSTRATPIQVRNRSGQTTDATNFRSDFSLDGSVDCGDAITVRSRSGTAIPWNGCGSLLRSDPGHAIEAPRRETSVGSRKRADHSRIDFPPRSFRTGRCKHECQDRFAGNDESAACCCFRVSLGCKRDRSSTGRRRARPRI